MQIDASKCKRLLLASLVATITLSLTACGGGGENNEFTPNYQGLYNGTDYTSIATVSAAAVQPFDYVANGIAFQSYGKTCSASTSQNVVTTEHTVVYTDATNLDAATLSKIAQMTEASYLRLVELFGVDFAPGADGTSRIKVCASSNDSGNGSSGYSDLQIGIPSNDWQLARLIHHELVHVVEAQSLQCKTEQYRFERWLTEGLALHVAMQDLPTKSEVAGLKSNFDAADLESPYSYLPNFTYPDMTRYPAWRLAIDTFLGEFNKSAKDVNDFLISYGNTNGCPAWSTNFETIDPEGWKVQFDEYFEADLRGEGVLGSTFWSIAPNYAE